MNTSYKMGITCILALALLVVGCWDRRELDHLAIVSSIAYDTGDSPGTITATTQLILSGMVTTPHSGAGGEGTKKPIQIIQATGKTPFDAVRNMSFQSKVKPFFSHNPIVIIGEDMARQGVSKILDFHYRDPEHRRNSYLLIAEGKGSDILTVKTTQEEIPGLFLKNLLETAINATSKVAIINEQDFMELLMSKDTSPYATLVKVIGEGENQSLKLTGTAIFKKDKLVGKFNYQESRGLLWILGKIKSGIITVPCSQGDENVGLEIIHSHSKIIPQIKDDTLSVLIKIQEESNLGDQTCSSVDLTTPVAWLDLEKKQEEAIKKEIMAAIKKAQELNTDVFGFGDAIHRKYPQIWHNTLQEIWEEYFADIPVEVVVDTKIRRGGMITKPAIPQ